MSLTPNLRRWVSAGAVAALTATTLAIGAGSAEAAPSLGALAITPSTGNQDTLLNAQTNAHCNVDDTGIVVVVTGPGVTSGNGYLQGFTPIHMVDGASGLSFMVTGTLGELFQANSIAAPSGSYTVRVACIGADSFTETGEFTQNLTMTPNGTLNGANYVAPGEATTTTLAVSPDADPVVQGTSSTLTATVDPQDGTGDPTGSVQFKSGATNLGAPVALTPAGTASKTLALAAGSNNLTAQFIPSGAFFAGSTSAARSFVVVGPASIVGTPKVGSKVSCAITAGGTITYSWTKGGVIQAGITSKDVVVPATWLGGSVGCKATVTKNATSVTQTSAARAIAAGTFVMNARPKLVGTPKVGRKLTCAKGSWSPTPATYKYAWFRGTKAIPRATKPTYKLVAKDRGKKISCQVTVAKTGYAAAKAKSTAKKVS